MYPNSNVIVTGGSSTYVAGNSHHVHKHSDLIVHNHGSRPGFERLQEHVAAGALHNSAEVSDQPKCHPGTRVKILDHIIGWAAALTYTFPIIWLHGPAGAGKSAILRTIAQRLFDQQLLLASFFFFRTAVGRNSSDKFIGTIAYQLAVSIPATRLHIEQAIEKSPLMFSLSLWDQAHALIVSPILAVLNDPSFDASQHPRVLIVDGLDECHNPDRQCEILQVLCRVLQNLPIPFAALVASRPEHHIRAAFDLDELNMFSSRLFLDNSYKPDTDIKKYLTDRFSEIQAKHPFRSCLPAHWPLPGVIDKLVARGSGQFIYASTVNNFISSLRHNPAKRLDIILGTLDAGASKPFEQLDILYSTIFLTVDPVDLAGTLRILGVLLVPQEVKDYSSSPAFLEWLLGLETGDVRHLLFDLESLLTIGSDHENVQFFHASLSDFLVDKSRSDQFWIDAGMVYADLAQRCLVLLPESVRLNGPLCFVVANFDILSKATPIPGLREAIQKIDLTKVVDEYIDIHPQLLQAIRSSKFTDAEQLYRTQLSTYTSIIKPRIQVYLQDIPLKYFLVTSIMFYEDLTSSHRDNLEHIFRLSSEIVGQDISHGFKLVSTRPIDPASARALMDILFDPKGEYFVDDNVFADIAVYLMESITQISRFYETPGHRQKDEAVEATVAKIFPHCLSKSPIRHELTEHIKRHEFGRINPEYSQIEDAMMDYLSRPEPVNKSSHKSAQSEPQSSKSISAYAPNKAPETKGNTSGVAPDAVATSSTGNAEKVDLMLKGQKRWWKSSRLRF